jgi:hypothetical protein
MADKYTSSRFGFGLNPTRRRQVAEEARKGERVLIDYPERIIALLDEISALEKLISDLVAALKECSRYDGPSYSKSIQALAAAEAAGFKPRSGHYCCLEARVAAAMNKAKRVDNSGG